MVPGVTIGGCITKVVQSVTDQFDFLLKNNMSDGNKKKNCASAVSHSQRTSQRYMISYNAQFVICRGKEGVRKRRGLWKGKWEGGFVSIFPTVGIGNKQMLSITNRLPSFSNEEVKGWRVGCKWGADEQQAPSNRPVCDVAEMRMSVKDVKKLYLM